MALILTFYLFFCILNKMIKLAVPIDKAIKNLQRAGLYGPLCEAFGESCLQDFKPSKVLQDTRCAYVFAALKAIRCVRGNMHRSFAGTFPEAPAEKRWDYIINASLAVTFARLSATEICSGLEVIKNADFELAQ